MRPSPSVSGLVLDLDPTQDGDGRGGAHGTAWEIQLWCQVPALLQSDLQRPGGQGLLIAIFLVAKLRPHFKSITKPCFFSILISVRLFPFSHPVVSDST